jgi:hypothetical protein
MPQLDAWRPIVQIDVENDAKRLFEIFLVLKSLGRCKQDAVVTVFPWQSLYSRQHPGVISAAEFGRYPGIADIEQASPSSSIYEYAPSSIMALSRIGDVCANARAACAAQRISKCPSRNLRSENKQVQLQNTTRWKHGGFTSKPTPERIVHNGMALA